MKRQEPPVLLNWSQHVPASDVQDPLGLGLRASARLASSLLYCITSITPRARYFSFIPWCIFDQQQGEKGKSKALGLRAGIILREKALVLGCVVHHNGLPCAGGGLVGSTGASKWFANSGGKADFGEIENFSRNPALDAYIASLVNLGIFVTEEERPDSDDEEEEIFTFDDIELSKLGLDLAQRFGTEVDGLGAVRQLSTGDQRFELTDLAEFGERAGLCELSKGSPLDRELLRDIFFRRIELKGESHKDRRQSLLLLLELYRQLEAADQALKEQHFASSVYFGQVGDNESRISIKWPPELADIAMRWRMFYFHHYMSVAIEGLFSWLVTQVGELGLAGATVDSLVELLREPALQNSVSEILGVEMHTSFEQMTPASLCKLAGICDGVLDEVLSRAVDDTVPSGHPFAEDTLERQLRSVKHLYSSAGLALPLVLLSITLARYFQWKTSKYGTWLAGNAHDPYLDLVPPLVDAGLTRRFGNWWNTTFADLGGFILNRHVVQQHQAMSYEKFWTGERCLLEVDGSRIVATGRYEEIGMGNARFKSAIQILADLGLVEKNSNGIDHLTEDGKSLLDAELRKEAEHEVS